MSRIKFKWFLSLVQHQSKLNTIQNWFQIIHCLLFSIYHQHLQILRIYKLFENSQYLFYIQVDFGNSIEFSRILNEKYFWNHKRSKADSWKYTRFVLYCIFFQYYALNFWNFVFLPQNSGSKNKNKNFCYSKYRRWKKLIICVPLHSTSCKLTN